jgi:hypothetical protein
MNGIDKRIELIMEHYSMNSRSFTEHLGLNRDSNSMVCKIVNGKGNPSYETLVTIIEKCADIDVEWLMTGKGNMLKISKDDAVFYKNQVDRMLTVIQNLTDKGEKNVILEEIGDLKNE